MNDKLALLNSDEVNTLIDIATSAGEIILQYYQKKDVSFSLKNDQSEVTIADLEANKFIISKINKYFPDFPIVSEENSTQDNLQAAQADVYFMIDPLDGTKGFIKKSDQFTVNIALIKNNRPIFGVVYLPAADITYYTNSEFVAYKIIAGEHFQISPVQNISDNPTIICTRREPEKTDIVNWLGQKNIGADNLASVESSYKFCLIAEGKADLYPRKVSLNAWDVAAGEAIVEAAGGIMCDYSGKKLNYSFVKNFKVPSFIVFGNFSLELGNE